MSTKSERITKIVGASGTVLTPAALQFLNPPTDSATLLRFIQG